MPLDAGSVRAIWSEAIASAQERGSKITSSLVQGIVERRRTSSGQHPLVHLSSESQDWHTPPAFLSLVRAVFTGGIVELDPCSDAVAQARVQARRYYSADGLTQAWEGRVFVNSPFEVASGLSQQAQFFQKAVAEYNAGHATEIILLLKAAVGYAWFTPALQWPHGWLHAQVAFLAENESCTGGPDKNPHGSVVV